MNNSFELFGFLNKDFYIAQMNYSWACLRLLLLSFVGLLLSYFVVGFISWSNRMTGNCTKMFLTTLRATMTPQTPIPASNPILASMPNIYLIQRTSYFFIHFNQVKKEFVLNNNLINWIIREKLQESTKKSLIHKKLSLIHKKICHPTTKKIITCPWKICNWILNEIIDLNFS